MFKRYQEENLDVYSIQNNAQEILYTLSGLEKISVPEDFALVNFEGAPILFKNLETNFVLNDIKVPVNFPYCLYYKGPLDNGEYEGRLIKFMEGSTFSQDTVVNDRLSFKQGDILDLEAIKTILQAKGIKYIEDDTPVNELYSNKIIESKALTQEIWFGRDMNILPESLASTKDKRIIFYPNVKGYFQLIWKGFPYGEVIYEMLILGLIELDDKIMLRIMPKKEVVEAINFYEKHGIKVAPIVKYDPLRFGHNVLADLEKKGFEIYRSEETPEFLKNINSIRRK